MDYTTLAQVKAFNSTGIGIPSTEDTFLSTLITAMSGQMDNHCNQILGYKSFVNLPIRADVNRWGGIEFYVPSPLIQSVSGLNYRIPNTTFVYPITDLTSILTEDRDSGSKMTVVNNNFQNYRLYGTIWVQVSYAGGWNAIGGAAPVIPQSIQIACTRLVHWMYQKRNSPMEALGSDNTGVVHTTSAWPNDVKQELRNYRKYTV